MSTATLITLPLLALISIPLAITASITIFFSAIALYFQLLVVSIELCYALLTNLFTIPPSPSWSLLSFTVSAPNTPDRRRSSDYGFLQSPLLYRGQSQPQGQIQSHPTIGPRMGSSNSPDFQDSDDTRRPNLQRNKPFTGFLSLISGQNDRDFEGLGGWRCPPSTTKSPGYRSGRTTPSPSNSVNDEADDMAWLSINSRLELPSQPLTLRHGHRNSQSNSQNPKHIINNDPLIEPQLPWQRNSRASISAAPEPKRSKIQGQRHHRRSATTSLVSGFGVRSPNSQVLVRLDPGLAQGQTVTNSGASLRSRSHTSLFDHYNSHAGPMKESLGSGGGSGGYFALQPKGLRIDGGTGARTTTNTTPNEERRPARMSIVSLAHYVPSLRNR
ncbi:hypothetical protein BJX99DRAFT_256170 [Aspergillus californicus]